MYMNLNICITRKCGCLKRLEIIKLACTHLTYLYKMYSIYFYCTNVYQSLSVKSIKRYFDKSFFFGGGVQASIVIHIISTVTKFIYSDKKCI